MSRLRPWQIALGIGAGLLAGLAHVGVLAALFGLPVIAGLAGTDEPATGLVIHLMLSALMGIAYAWLFKPVPESYAESVMTGLVYGLLWWMFLSLNLIPIAAGQGPQWQVEDAASAFSTLVGYLFQGSLVGLGYSILSDLVLPWLGLGDEAVEVSRSLPVEHRIVILGGGFAGVTTAQHLERLFQGDERVAITLISNTNHLLFTPMLSEITAGGVESQHISTPLRAFFNRTQVIRGEVEAVDLERRTVRLAADGGATGLDLPFEHLVLALGAVTNFFGLERVKTQAFTFKSLEDATLLRNHVIEMLERADAEPNPERRKRLLTFVVAGGGFAGAELVGALNDFVRGSRWFYPNIPAEEVSLILVQSGDRIMPELSTDLAEYALEKMKARGVTFKLATRVLDAVPGEVLLNNGESIRTGTLVWTASNSPNPLVRQIGVELNERGAVRTEATLSVARRANVWALGDCAAVVDGRTGKPCPPTAQHALRQAATLAHNIQAAIRGRKSKPFSYQSRGSLAVLGHQTACAEIWGVRFSGSLAWWLWRTFYLLKLPTLEKKIRVALDWTIDLFFPRDIVQTMNLRQTARTSALLHVSRSGIGEISRDEHRL